MNRGRDNVTLHMMQTVGWHNEKPKVFWVINCVLFQVNLYSTKVMMQLYKGQAHCQIFGVELSQSKQTVALKKTARHYRSRVTKLTRPVVPKWCAAAHWCHGILRQLYVIITAQR